MAEDTSSTPLGEGLSPVKRKRLQQCYEHANLQMRQENFDYATELFTQCVVGDPANLMYVQGFLGNLKQKYKNNKKGDKLAAMKTLGARGLLKKSAMQKDWVAVFKSGLEILKLNPWDVGALRTIAAACEEVSADESQLAFLRMALEANPKDADVCQLCAEALGRRRLFDQAIALWHRVEQIRPGDEEAARQIASLTVQKTINDGRYEDGDGGKFKGAKQNTAEADELSLEQRLQRSIRRNPDDLTKYTELAELYLREDQFVKAEKILHQAFERSDGNPDMRERWEDAQMRHLRHKLAQAEKQAHKSGRDEDQQRFEKIKHELHIKDMEFCKGRVERFPNNLAFKFDLAVRLQLVGRYTEAIAEYQKAQNDPKRKGLCMLALGQCFQNIKQYGLAIKHYELAVQEIPDRDPQNKKKALYLAGKLAMHLGNVDGGERYLTTLAGMDFAFRDVSSLLDKIAEIRKNRGEKKEDDQKPEDMAPPEESPPEE